MKPRLCPNCGSKVNGHPENGCVIQALIGVISDRGSVGERRLLELHANIDVDAVWTRLGPIIDDIEAGTYS